jgi:hypothetical protein
MYLLILILFICIFIKINKYEKFIVSQIELNVGLLSLESILPYTRSEVQILSYIENNQTNIPRNFVFKQLVRENPNIFKSVKLPMIPPSSFNKFITTNVPSYIHCAINIMEKMSLLLNLRLRYFIYTDINEIQSDLKNAKINFMIVPLYKNFVSKNTLITMNIGTLFHLIPVCVNCKEKKYYEQRLLDVKKNSFSFYLLETKYNFKYFIDNVKTNRHKNNETFIQYYVSKKKNDTYVPIINDNTFIPMMVYTQSPLNEKKFLPKKLVSKVRMYLENLDKHTI